LQFERAIVLQNLSNVIVLLYPMPVVARVGTTNGKQMLQMSKWELTDVRFFGI
jgi:Mg/Co/Ni transporter MgtE